MKMDSRVKISFTDTGGTFTDTFMTDEKGDMIIGKASTTPEDVSVGFFNSLSNAAEKIGLELEELCSQLMIIGFSSTIVTNALITGKGVKTGLIVTKGFENILLMEGGKQTWAHLYKADRAHFRTHRHNDPTVPFYLTEGVTERVDSTGQVVISLYEQEAREAAKNLIDNGADAIAVCFLFCWQNDVHERVMGRIIKEVAKEMGKNVDVYLSVDINPTIRELHRANATIMEARVSPLVSGSLGLLSDRLKGYGYKGTLQIMQSHGGLATFDSIKTIDQIGSGPVGGLIGSLYIGKIYGFENVIGTDVGGTSFDVGIINKGILPIDREILVERMLFSIPKAGVTSIGAGGGTFIKVDQETGRLVIGPESAGAVPGPICYNRGGDVPTISDVDLLLGYLNPDYFLGGKIKLNKEPAYKVFKERVADPLGMSVMEAASGVREIIDMRMKDAIAGNMIAMGSDIRDFYVLGFGSAGPTHVAGYTDELFCRGIMCFPYSSVFSAFGAATADYQHHYNLATNIVVPSYTNDDIKLSVGRRLNELWSELESKALTEMEKEGFQQKEVKLRHLAMTRYGKQLEDIIVISPVHRIENIGDWDSFIRAFESQYKKMYSSMAKYPKSGYEIHEVGLVSWVEKPAPVLRKHLLSSQNPPHKALKELREAMFKREIYKTKIYEWNELKAGNNILGPAILESPTTTLVVPPHKLASIDEYMTVWLKER